MQLRQRGRIVGQHSSSGLVSRAQTLVIGAGTGALAALSLAESGLRVTLVDRAPGLFTRASGHNGRRLHLGEHYSADIVPAHDTWTVNTGRLCFLGALQLARRFPFLPSPAAAWWQFLPPGSMTTPAGYDEHLAGLRTFHRRLADIDPVVDALFGPADKRHAKLDLSRLRRYVPVSGAAAGYSSRESVIDLARLRREIMRRLIAVAPAVDVMFKTDVVGIEGTSAGYRVVMRTAAGKLLTATYTQVVNATWSEIPTLAEMVSNAEPPAGVVRLKLLVTSRMPKELVSQPSFYFHRGVYGSHTNAGSDLAIISAECISNLAFTSLGSMSAHWHSLLDNGLNGSAGVNALAGIVSAPASGAGSTGDNRGRRALVAAIDAARRCEAYPRSGIPENPGIAAQRELARRVVRTYSEFVPIFRNTPATGLRFATVVTSDHAYLADPLSPVHRRSFHVDEVAPGFYNFNPGKLTLAQLAADYLCNMACPGRRVRLPRLDGAINELLRDMQPA
jgi:glycine/D-amino acid oxidase-like deaminating enzyme